MPLYSFAYIITQYWFLNKVICFFWQKFWLSSPDMLPMSCTGSRACGLSTLDTLLPQRPPQEWCLHRWSSHTWTHPRGHCRVRQTLWTLKGVSPPPKSSRSDKSRARRQVFTLLWERTVFPKNGAGPTGPPYTKEGTWTLTSHYTQKVIKTRPKS